MGQARERAASLLGYYFGLNMNMDADNYIEMEQIVDLIIEAAVEEIEANLPTGPGE